MKRKLVSCDPTKCNGCGICELACSKEKEKSFNSLFSRIHSTRLQSIKEPLSSIAIACVLCEDPPCVKYCPRNCLSSNENGTIRIDAIKCNGCGLCVAACEFGAISLDPEKKTALVCDLCNDEPKCVELCPKDALNFATFDEAIQKSELENSKLIMQEFMEAQKHPKTFYEREGFLPVSSSNIDEENIRKMIKRPK